MRKKRKEKERTESGRKANRLDGREALSLGELREVQQVLLQLSCIPSKK